MTSDEKLDHLIEQLHLLHVDLSVHIAKDESQWERVADTEEEIKNLTKAAAKFSKKQAAIIGSMSAGVATVASIVTKALL